MEHSKDIVLESDEPSTFLDLSWRPGVAELLGQDTFHRLLQQAIPTPKHEADDYHPPLFNPANIGLNWSDPRNGMDVEMLECILFRKRGTFLASLVTPKPLVVPDPDMPPLSSMEKRTKEGAAVFSPSNVDQDLLDEESVYMGQSILLSLLVSSHCPESLRATIADVFSLHCKSLMDTLLKLLPSAPGPSPSSWNPMLFLSLLGGLLMLVDAPELVLSTRVALEMIPLLGRLQVAIVESGLPVPPLHEKRKGDEALTGHPLKRQRTATYGRPEDMTANVNFATAVQIMLDNVESTMAGSSGEIGPQHSYESSTAGLRSEDVDCVRMIMLYLNVSGQTAKQLLRAATSASMVLPATVSPFAQVMLYVATHPSHLPLMQIEMEMECIKTSLSLLFELQMTITAVEHQEEAVQVLNDDVHQKLRRWKGAISVLLSLGWSIGSSGWCQLEYFKAPRGVPHLQDAKRLLTKYIGICELRLKQLQETHVYLYQQQQIRVSKTETPELAFACPWTAHTFLLAADLVDHVGRVEPWLRTMVYARLHKLFWQPPLAQGTFSATFPTYSSSRHEVQTALGPPGAFWGLFLQHVTHVRSRLEAHLVQLPLPTNALPYDCLYVVPVTPAGAVDFALAAVYPTETRLVQALAPTVAGSATDASRFLRSLTDAAPPEGTAAWLEAVAGPPLRRKPTPGFTRVERLVLSLVLMLSGAVDVAATLVATAPSLEKPLGAWRQFRRWLEQHAQTHGDALPLLEAWCLFLHQVWVGPSMALWTAEASNDHAVTSLLAFLRAMAGTPLTLPLRQTVLMQRRVVWLHLVGLHLLAQPPPACHDLALRMLLQLFAQPAPLQPATSRGWLHLIRQSQHWPAPTSASPLLHALWRQSVASVGPHRANPCQEGALRRMLVPGLPADHWPTVLAMVAGASPQNATVAPLVLGFLQRSVADDAVVGRATALARIALAWGAVDAADDWRESLVLPLLARLPSLPLPTQHQVLALLATMLPRLAPDAVVAEFLLLLAACQQPVDAPHPRLLVAPPAVSLETPLYADVALSFHALAVLQSLRAAWAPVVLPLVDAALLDGLAAPTDARRRLRRIGALMLASDAGPAYAFFPGQRIAVATADDATLEALSHVQRAHGVLLGVSADAETCRASADTLFLSRSVHAQYFTTQCSLGLLVPTATTAVLPADVRRWATTVERHLETLQAMLPTPEGLWLLHAAGALMDAGVIDRERWTAPLLELAVAPLAIPLPTRAKACHALQPPTYWQAQLVYRCMAIETERVRRLVAAPGAAPVLSGLLLRPRCASSCERPWPDRPPHRPSTLAVDEILTPAFLAQIANLPTSTTASDDMARLLNMGWPAGLSAYALRYYPGNVTGALQWLTNENNADDVHRIRMQNSVPPVDRPAAPARVRQELKNALLAPYESEYFHHPAPVLDALRQVPRECFVPSLYQKDVETDAVIQHPLGFTVPSMAQCYQLVHALDLRPGVSVLDVGTGSGYFVTLLAHLYGNRLRLTSWERDVHRLAYAYMHMAKSVQCGDTVRRPYFMDAITFEVCDAFAHTPGPVFDRVHVGASCPRESVHLLFALVADHGILVVPIDGTLYRVEKSDRDWETCRKLALGTLSIESLVAPSVELLATVIPTVPGIAPAVAQGLHGFEERASGEKPLVLRWNVEDPYAAAADDDGRRDALRPGLRVSVRLRSHPLVQRGLSEAGFTAVRLGGARCQLRELSMGVKISDASLKVSNRGSFGTACANVAVRGGGRWFYEIRIGTSKVIQIGWVLPGFDPNPESGLGVGDDSFSYAYDGRRKKKWFCGRNEEYCKQMCKAGDVVGCMLDLDAGTMTFYLNGVSLGVAFSELERDILHGGYAPACSMDGGESVWFNFGATPFAYPPPPTPAFCALTNFTYPPLPTPPRLAIAVVQSVDADVVTVVTDDHASYVVPVESIAPVDEPLAQWIPSSLLAAPTSAASALASVHAQLVQHEAVAYLRWWLFATARKRLPLAAQARLLEVTSEGRVFPTHLVFAASRDPAADVAWLQAKMTAQLHCRHAAEMMVLEASRHPLSTRLIAVSVNVSSCLKMIRTHLSDVDAHLDKGQTRAAFTLLQRITDVVLEKTNRENGDHLQRCRLSLDKVYQAIRTADLSYPPDMSLQLDHLIQMELAHRRNPRPLLEKVVELKKALQTFEELVAPSSIVPIETVHGKYVGIPTATSLLVEFDTRTTRSHWKLVFYADQACTRRLPWVLSRDGLRPFVVPANYFYYSFVPDPQASMTAEWGYAFRVTPYRTASPPLWAPWKYAKLAGRLEAMVATSGDVLDWLGAALTYCRIPGARRKEDVMAWLLRALETPRRLDPAVMPSLRQFLYCALPELNLLFRDSVRWQLHNNRYFQVLLQLCTSLLAQLPDYAPPSYAVDAFGYHAEQHPWHEQLVATVHGLSTLADHGRVDVGLWQPEVGGLYHSLRVLKEALKQFEASVKSEVQRWHKNRRECWLRQVEQAYHPTLLAPLLIVFNETLSASSRDGGWSSEKAKWLRNVHAACTVGALARQLLVLAGCIDADAHSPAWSCQSYDWRKAVVNLTKEPYLVDSLLPVAAHWTDGCLLLDQDAGPMPQHLFEDNSKLFRVREARNVHIMGSFGELVLIRKVSVRIPKKYTNTPCVAGVIFVFHETPTADDMAKLRQYDHFTSDKYQEYVGSMRAQQLIPLPGDPIGFFDVGSPHFLQGNNVITVVPEFAILGRVVIVKLLRCYNIRAMEDLADTVKRDEEHGAAAAKDRAMHGPVYLWCYKPHEEWLPYPSDVEYTIETQYQGFCSGESLTSHATAAVAGEDVVVDLQRMVQYAPSRASIMHTPTCRVKRLVVPVDLKVKLTTHHCMEVEYIGLYGLAGQAAHDAYSSWTLQYHNKYTGTGAPTTATPTSELYRVLSDKAPVYSFPGLAATTAFHVLYGEIVVVAKRLGRWGRLVQGPGAPEAWVLLDSHQPAFFPIPRAQAAAHAAVPWLHDVFCVAPAGDTYKGTIVAELPPFVNTTLVDAVNRLRELRGRCALSLVANDVDQFLDSDAGRHARQRLQAFSLPVLMGRLDVLRHLNQRLVPYVMLLGIGSSLARHHPTWLAGLVTRAKGLLFLETKMAVWKKIWSESYSMERSSEVVSINRHVAFKVRAELTAASGQLDMAGRRDRYASTVFCQLYEELRHTPPALLRRNDGKSWFTKFKGEPSIDDGGLYRETNATICFELNHSLVPLFCTSANGQNGDGLDQNALVPNLMCLEWAECCDWWAFVGVLMGIATQNLEEVFPVALARPVWKLLVGEALTPEDLPTFDAAAARTLAFLRDPSLDAATFEATFPDLAFTCLTDQNVEVEIVPQGRARPVSFADRFEYADALEQWKLHQFDGAVAYVAKGLRSIVHADLLAVFTWQELELLVCGRPTLNLELLKKKTEYSPDMDSHDTLVQRFWRTLAAFSPAEQQQFLQFVWGRSRLPFSEVDFGTYTFKLVRHMSAGNPDEYLPVAHTCFFQLELPNYSTDAIMKAKLLYAMQHCTSIVDEEQAAQQRDIALWDS
ncbi:HECTdomain (ubiquitin-transferase) domain containing protein [Achlya hypogyna]|uniref:HECTdomain (Ubiquitin-transferase) domain containing protein n=1 Tax=Achlya hypogyna TaxID=1202772 RepID=A0A1V9ZAL7_ACHHY|nr:HECTdomain (ubiquitin-transferase) domain containing protein [Achlya hypogyna]